MALRRYTRLTALLVGAIFATGPIASAGAEPHSGSAIAHPAKTKRLTKKQRAAIRRELAREVRRNPGSILKPKFVKKATLVDYQMPLTVRIGTPVGMTPALDDQIEITWDDSIDPWPLAGTTPAPVQTVTLTSGLFTMQADFGGDASGTGELGAVETLSGGDADIRSEPFDIASDPACLDGSGDPLPARVQAYRTASLSQAQGPHIKFTSGGVRSGLLNLFSQELRGSVVLQTSFISEISDSSCATPAEAGPPTTVSPAFPLRYSGSFHLSPAITSDGKMRLGKIVVDDASVPQASSLAKFSSCVDLLTPCTEAQFTAHVKIKHLTADVLLGDIRSS